MKIEVYTKFKDGTAILTKNPYISSMGLWYLNDDISLNCNSMVVYESRGNVICGEDITSMVSEITITVRH